MFRNRYFDFSKFSTFLSASAVFCAFFLGRDFVESIGFEAPKIDVCVAASNEISTAKLFAPTSIECDAVPLKSALERYSKIFGTTYFIDRRVDPQTPIYGSFSNVPFIDAATQMLNDADLSLCVVNDSVFCVGPRDAAGELLLLFALKRDESAAYPKVVSEKLGSTIDFTVDDFAEPRETFQALSKKLRLKFSGFEKTPFDRWRSAEFRNVVASDLVSMFALGFGVDYRWDAADGAIKPVALDRSRSIERLYPREATRRLNRKDFPNCRFQDETIDGIAATRVSGTFADVAPVELAVSTNRQKDWISTSTSASSTKPTPNAANRPNSSEKTTNVRKEVSGPIKNVTLRDLFAYLRSNFGATFELDSSLNGSKTTLETRVSCEFNNADLPKVASTIARELGVDYRIDGTKVVFTAKK